MSVNPILITEASKIITESVKVFGEYLETKEEEKTERARIRATLAAITLKIEAEKEIFFSLMENSFAERERLYTRADKALNKAIEDGDIEMAKLAIGWMDSIYHKNPLDGLQQSQGFLSGGNRKFLD